MDFSKELFATIVLASRVQAAEYISPEQVEAERLKAEQRAEIRRQAIADSRRIRASNGPI